MMRKTRGFGPILGLCALLGGCQANAPKTAIDVIARSKAALANVERVSYRAEYEGSGWLQARVPAVKGVVVMGPESEWDIARFRCEVTLKSSDSDEELRFISGSNGDIYFLIDPTTNMAHEDMDPAVLGSHGRDIQRVLMAEFVSKDPYGKEIEPGNLKLSGSQRVGNEDCYEIQIDSDSPPKMVWLVSKKDFLPRRVTRIYPNRSDPDGEPGTTQLTLFDVAVNPTHDENPFVLHLPDGYTRTDDFAP